MKKIYKQIKLLMLYYRRYRLIVTNEHIELKITPKSNNENELNWIVENDKDGKLTLYYSLLDLYNETGASKLNNR